MKQRIFEKTLCRPKKGLVDSKTCTGKPQRIPERYVRRVDNKPVENYDDTPQLRYPPGRSPNRISGSLGDTSTCSATEPKVYKPIDKEYLKEIGVSKDWYFSKFGGAGNKAGGQWS